LFLLWEKIKESFFSALPIILLVLIINLTILPCEISVLINFFVGAILVILGMALFLYGVEMGITPIGNLLGASVKRIQSKIWVIALAGIILGFFVSVAEPDLHILAGQVDAVTSGFIDKLSIIVVVSIGIALLFSFGLIRILYNIPLYIILTILYTVILILSFFTPPHFLIIAFDSSGATTGALTVPFFLAIAMGVSSLKKDVKAAEKDSFGLIAIVSTGAIIAVMLMAIISPQETVSSHVEIAVSSSTNIFTSVIMYLTEKTTDSLLAFAPLLIIFLVFQKILFHLPKKQRNRALLGILYSFIGLSIFLTGAYSGFIDIGIKIGYNLAAMDNKAYLIIIGFLLGLFIVLAEPAVYVLTKHIENVTSGYINRKMVLSALAIGIGISVALSILRILIPSLQLWHYLLPGYIIAIAMSYIVPKIFVGIAFDSGGVASGPMTATFILAFTQGAAESISTADPLVDGFGIIAMVALTPLITIQILGLIYKSKSRKRGCNNNEFESGNN